MVSATRPNLTTEMTQTNKPRSPILTTPRSLICKFLRNTPYLRPRYPQPRRMEKRLRREILGWGIPSLRGKQLDGMITPSCAMAEMSYHKHDDYTTKYLIALFTFFMIYIDDKSQKGDPIAFARFQHHYLTSEPQIDPVLDRFAEFLQQMWYFYGTFSANAIVASTLEFVNGCYLERITQGMNPNPNASRYPYFLRSKTGVAQAYAFMIFPQALHSDVTTYVQAAPSISYWIDIVNDILSYYKEVLAKETNNYVNLRAAVGNTEPIAVVRELVKDALDTAESIEKTLDGKALKAWKVFKTGYITFHVSQDRYKLSDLGLNF